MIIKELIKQLEKLDQDKQLLVEVDEVLHYPMSFDSDCLNIINIGKKAKHNFSYIDTNEKEDEAAYSIDLTWLLEL